MHHPTTTRLHATRAALTAVLAIAAAVLAACGGGGASKATGGATSTSGGATGTAVGGAGSRTTTAEETTTAGETTTAEETTDEDTRTGFTVAPTTPGGAVGLPTGWAALRLPSGGALPYPTSWRPISGDFGSASAALLNADGTIRAYLNATPADSQEQPRTWARFRVEHNGEEGDRHVRLIASQRRATLGKLTGSCVSDQYQTTRTSYREIACIVSSRTGGRRVVLVGAAQPRAWAAEQRTLKFAIDHFTL